MMAWASIFAQSAKRTVRADPLGQLGVGRLDERLPFGGDDHRQPLVVDAGRGQQPLALGILGEVPAVGDLVASEELTHV